MSGLVAGVVLATVVVAWVLYPLFAGQKAPLERGDEELTEAQHRKRMALFALRDVEYDYHAGKLDEEDYRKMKRRVSSEALAALDEEEKEWAAREGRRAAEATESGSASGANDADARARKIEEEIAALRASLREGSVCRECGHPNPRGYRFCSECGGALPRSASASDEDGSAGERPAGEG